MGKRTKPIVHGPTDSPFPELADGQGGKFSINPDYFATGEGVYVIHHPSGYSCLGFVVCADRSGGYADWLHANGAPVQSLAGLSPAGTPEAYRLYCRLVAAVREVHQSTGKRCTAELTPQLVGLEGHRVEVVDCYGDRRRFIVGKSTGFIPCHLEVTRRGNGGPAVMGAPFESVRDLGPVR